MLFFESGQKNLDLNGTRILEKYGERIADDSLAKGIIGHKYNTTWLRDMLQGGYARRLKTIDLSKNFIGDEGAQQLGELLSADDVLPDLKKLDLSNNRIGKDGLLSFILLLTRSKFEKLIIYGNNQVTRNEVMKELTESLNKETNDDSLAQQYLSKIIWNLREKSPKEREHKGFYLAVPLDEEKMKELK